ncbi:MAG: succinate dehydrogenase, cytochrome b556 subunit [Aestuariivirgaceae bacterium]
MSSTSSQDQRPLSPHLQVYKPMLTMMMSIIHRITGVVLYFGTFLVVWWLVAAAVGPGYFNMVNGFFSSWFGVIVLLGYTWTLIHHALGGLRHLVWDTGRGFDLDRVEWMAKANLAGSIVLTLLVWAIVHVVR